MVIQPALSTARGPVLEDCWPQSLSSEFWVESFNQPRVQQEGRTGGLPTPEFEFWVLVLLSCDEDCWSQSLSFELSHSASLEYGLRTCTGGLLTPSLSSEFYWAVIRMRGPWVWVLSLVSQPWVRLEDMHWRIADPRVWVLSWELPTIESWVLSSAVTRAFNRIIVSSGVGRGKGFVFTPTQLTSEIQPFGTRLLKDQSLSKLSTKAQQQPYWVSRFSHQLTYQTQPRSSPSQECVSTKAQQTPEPGVSHQLNS